MEESLPRLDPSSALSATNSAIISTSSTSAFLIPDTHAASSSGPGSYITARAGRSSETIVLGICNRRTLANRLAAYQSRLDCRLWHRTVICSSAIHRIYLHAAIDCWDLTSIETVPNVRKLKCRSSHFRIHCLRMLPQKSFPGLRAGLGVYSLPLLEAIPRRGNARTRTRSGAGLHLGTAL